ncbi:MAG: hypothetical protein UX52_C0011G0027 [Candidatus Amesbacteria bacterium GW2011_GWA1_46_35]|nr:MAG: hypothetical protein UX52_C0011G0027 [Candidatus Amesbacteria bacterium GW2011_GWA1_46_35]
MKRKVPRVLVFLAAASEIGEDLTDLGLEECAAGMLGRLRREETERRLCEVRTRREAEMRYYGVETSEELFAVLFPCTDAIPRGKLRFPKPELGASGDGVSDDGVYAQGQTMANR